MSRLERLNARYSEHHRVRSADFVWGGAERAIALRRLVGGPGRRVLDLGCRYGALTRFYQPGNEVVGVDVDRDALHHAHELGIETVWGDVEQGLDFEDESFDVVVVAELLEHLRDPRWLMAEAARVLRPRGTIAGSVPNAYRLKNRLAFLAGRPPDANPTHLHMFRGRDVRELLQEFANVRLEYIVGRFVALNSQLFANIIVFSGCKPA